MWNYGDIIDAVARRVPEDRPALIQGERRILWGEFDARTNNLATNWLRNGARPGDKVAFYLRNCPEYSEGIAAAFKARLTHVNVNYRYVARELTYLLDNSDAAICVFDAEFLDHVTAIREHLPHVRQWVIVNGTGLDSAVDAAADTALYDYDQLVADGDGAPLPIERSPDDMLFLYTGGTTGMPKGVMWRHEDLWCVLGAGGNWRLGIPACQDLEEHLDRVISQPHPVNLPLPPIMHGTGLLSAINAMTHGGTCVTLTARSFEPSEALRAIDTHKVTATTIVGDAFARPMVETLEQNPGTYDIESLRLINSSGVMWTREIKSRLLQHNPELALSDGFSSSEAIGLGSSLMTRDNTVEVASFVLGEHCRVFDETLNEVGPGGSGMVGVSGHIPVGYYKDPEKTARTFPVIDGVRYSIPGDWVRVEADRTLTLLGRGSNCINTAGEKVFPEEVEEVLKLHDDVSDALVVGLDDPKWGAAVTAVVQLADGTGFDETALLAFCREHLAGYKVPKRVIVKADLERAPNGKADYAKIRTFAATQTSG